MKKCIGIIILSIGCFITTTLRAEGLPANPWAKNQSQISSKQIQPQPTKKTVKVQKKQIKKVVKKTQSSNVAPQQNKLSAETQLSNNPWSNSQTVEDISAVDSPAIQIPEDSKIARYKRKDENDRLFMAYAQQSAYQQNIKNSMVAPHRHRGGVSKISAQRVSKNKNTDSLFDSGLEDLFSLFGGGTSETSTQSRPSSSQSNASSDMLGLDLDKQVRSLERTKNKFTRSVNGVVNNVKKTIDNTAKQMENVF